MKRPSSIESNRGAREHVERRELSRPFDLCMIAAHRPADADARRRARADMRRQEGIFTLDSHAKKPAIAAQNGQDDDSFCVNNCTAKRTRLATNFHLGLRGIVVAVVTRHESDVIASHPHQHQRTIRSTCTIKYFPSVTIDIVYLGLG